MAAFALGSIIPTRYYIRADSGATETDTDYGVLLDAVRLQTGSETAALYEFHPETSEFNAVTSRSSIGARVKDVGITLSSATSRWIGSLAGPTQGRPATEPNFERFPEVLQYQLKRLEIIPL